MIDWTNRHVLVIGGSGAIGSAVVAIARDAGAAVSATTHRDPPVSDEGVTWYELDITDPEAVDRLVADVAPDDVVVAAAARPFAGLLDMDDDDLRALVDTKLWGSFHVGRAVGHHLPEHGTLTYISGTLAAYPDVAAPVAAVSAAVESLARGLAVELAPIRVNAVSPDGLGSAGRGRHEGTAADVAELILSTVANPWMSGSVIEIHGAGKP